MPTATVVAPPQHLQIHGIDWIVGPLELGFTVAKFAPAPKRLLDDLVDRFALRTSVMRVAARFVYPMYTRILGGDDRVQFFNFGYEEDPPMGLALRNIDEAHRFSIQLYHRTATQADLAGARVLEVSCGHGGGAAFLARTLHPASYIGMDLNRRGIEFCQNTHREAGLSFLHGDAEHLPFDGGTFDTVLSIEASHHCADFPRFLGEVTRVLRPGGHFLYADLRPREEVESWEAALDRSPLRPLSELEINAEVLRGIRHNGRQVTGHLKERMPAVPWLRDVVGSVAARPFVEVERKLADGSFTYRIYSFTKD